MTVVFWHVTPYKLVIPLSVDVDGCGDVYGLDDNKKNCSAECEICRHVGHVHRSRFMIVVVIVVTVMIVVLIVIVVISVMKSVVVM